MTSEFDKEFARDMVRLGEAHARETAAPIIAERDALAAENTKMREAIEFTLGLLDGLTSDRFALGDDKPARDKLNAAIGRT